MDSTVETGKTENNIGKKDLIDKIRRFQISGKWTLVMNPYQTKIFDPDNNTYTYVKGVDGYFAGAIVVEDDWNNPELGAVYGEGVFINPDTYDIEQTGNIITLKKANDDLHKVARGVGAKVYWTGKVIERIKNLTRANFMEA